MFLSGCSDRAPQTLTESPNASPSSEEEESETDDSPATFDPDGNLIESDADINGLILPRGVERTRTAGLMRVYRLYAPIDKVLRYFGPRLMTTQVDRIGGGAVYRNAIPRGVVGGEIVMDVSILPVGPSVVRIEITERAPLDLHPPTEAETLEKARRDFARIE